MTSAGTKAAAFLAALFTGAAPPAVVQPNDNRTSAGRLAGDSLVVRFVVEMATWYPETDGGPSVGVAAFSEAGKAPQIPGPLIRVRTGTVIVATLHNALADSAITVFGFVTRPATVDSGVRLAPGERRTVRFSAGEPGTYFYWAVVGTQHPDVEREQLAGAFVIDPAGGSPPDRILVINIWGQPLDSIRYRNALGINGRSWPHTERFAVTVGDSLRWRVINPSLRNHPMHLHGVYYRVDSKGTALGDTTLAGDRRRLVVTENLQGGQTMTMAWRPDREGNWLFHCHVMFHAVEDARLDPADRPVHDRLSADAAKHMSGLVLGITVAPARDAVAEPRPNPRRLRLLVQQGPGWGRAARSLSFVLQRDDVPPAADSVEIPGSLLVLTRGEPTDITVINRLAEATAVHWHGIELESWSDGVAGWSGVGDRRAPAIAPGDSFTARLTLPRAGTFMYHTHLNDIEQVTSGLYGPIVVLEPGERFDSETDHVFLASWDGPRPPQTLVNGDSLPRLMTFRAGTAHRFRFINIGPAVGQTFSILRDSTVQTWRALAKDGADLPASQATERPAVQRVAVGEIYDFDFRPPVPGEYALVRWWDEKPIVVRRLIVR